MTTRVPPLRSAFSATFAPAGIGKLPIGPATLTELAGIGVGVVAEGDVVVLEAADLDGAWLDVVVPAVQAVTDRMAAQAVRASAARRYLFIWRPSVNSPRPGARRAQGQTRRPPCRAYPVLQTCDMRRVLARSGTGSCPGTPPTGAAGKCSNRAASGMTAIDPHRS